MIRRLLLPLVAVITILAMLMPGCTPTEYALTMAANPTAGGTATDVTGASPYAAGTEVDIQATANAGYVFTGWTTDAGGIFDDAGAATTKFSMPSNAVTVTAHFVPVFDLDMLANPNIGGTATDLTNTSPYTEDTEVDIQATANAGYVFSHWSAPDGTFDDASAATTTFTMPADDVIVTANFQSTGDPTYTLTMEEDPAGSGTATDLTGASPYAAGAFVTIHATANAGYVFSHWSAPGGTFDDETDPTTTFEMPAAHVTVTAHFVSPYELTLAVSPSGAGTTMPSGTTLVVAGVDVTIQATASAPYQFSHWSAPAGTFDDETDPTTTFEMPAEDVTVTAHFVGPLDHFTIYDVDWETAPPPIDKEVTLEDQFGVVVATVLDTVAFANPARKSHGGEETPIYNPDHHLTIYTIDYADEPQAWDVQVENQFGIQGLTVWGPIALAVPTQKIHPNDHEQPVGLDHYLIYQVTASPYIGETVEVLDEFGDRVDILVHEAMYFANPVKKTHGDEVTEILNPEDHVVIYWTDAGPFNEQVRVSNQFVDEQTLDIFGPTGLAVPSTKSSFFTPPLDHFKCYWAEDALLEPVLEPVILQDQFFFPDVLEATVGFVWWFGNPAMKFHEGSEPMIWNPDHHFTVYKIDCGADTGTWAVGVDNQFGTQHLTVTGPVALAVPTQKDIHPMPEGMDHYLIYEVVGYEGEPIDVLVGLEDQWLFDPGVLVTLPRFFANPVKKIHGEAVFDILNPDGHLVFWEIFAMGWDLPGLPIFNQFGEQVLNVYNPALLATPSWKLYVDPIG